MVTSKPFLVCFFKGHGQLWDRTDLDTGFLALKRVHPNLKSKFILKSALIFAVFCLIFNLTEKSVFECPFVQPIYIYIYIYDIIFITSG